MVMIAIQAGIIVLAILFVPPDVLTQVQAGQSPAPTQSNYLQVAAAVIALSLGFLLGFLGLKRLEQFDGEITELRRELMAGVEADRQLMSQEATRQQEAMSRQHAEFVDAFAERAENAVARAVALRQEKWIATLQEFEAISENRVEEIRESLTPYAWLEERKDDVDELVGMRTMGAVEKVVTQLFADGKVDVAVRIAEHAIGQSLPGAQAKFHNLATELSNQNLADLAGQVAVLGIGRFPADVDLLADAIVMNVDQGRLDEAHHWYLQLRGVPLDQWNWRAFTFAAEYLVSAGAMHEAQGVWRDFRASLPDEERAYSSEASHLIARGKTREAIELLEKGLAQCRHSPQSALQLSRAYLELGEYRRALSAADRAVESSYDEQPRIDRQAAVFMRAAAGDGLVHQTIQSGDRQALLEIVPRTVADYRLVMRLPGQIRYFSSSSSVRLEILRVDLLRAGCDREQVAMWFDDSGLADELSRSNVQSATSAHSRDVANAFQSLISDVVEAVHGSAPALSRVSEVVEQLASNDQWRNLADRIRRILSGGRNPDELLSGLDDIDGHVVASILERLTAGV